MTDVKIYTITSDDLSPPIKGEGFCTDMVRHSDYAALEERLNQMAIELKAVEQIHNQAVFISDEDYDQCPAVVQKMIGNLAVMLLPAADAWQREQMAKGVDAAITQAFNDGVPGNRMQFVARMTAFAAQLRNGEAV